MSGRTVALALILLAVAAAVFISACDDGGGGAGGTATPEQPTEEPTALFTSTPSQSIRQVDFETVQEVSDFIASAGDVSVGRIEYADLTYDNAEEAVVLISSGGEGGDIALFVYTDTPDGPEQLLRAIPDAGVLAAEIADGLLVIIEPRYDPGDPLCCPSARLRRVYDWDGEALVVTDETIVTE